MTRSNFGRGHAPPVVAGPVLKALGELRYATAAQITEHIGQSVTLHQVQRALSNAVQKKQVCNNGLVRHKGVKGGAAMSTYWLASDSPPAWLESRELDDLWRPNRKYRAGPRYASVWDYAQGLSANDSARRAA